MAGRKRPGRGPRGSFPTQGAGGGHRPIRPQAAGHILLTA
jgi:hypothetical protein